VGGAIMQVELHHSMKSWQGRLVDRDTMGIKIRECREDEIEELQSISYLTYDETFRHLNTPETMQKYLSESFNRDTLLDEIRNPNSTFYLMHIDDSLVGYLKLNEAPAQTDINDPLALEIERIYIYKQYKGRGFGKELMKFALEKAEERGKRYAWLGVWEKNVDAIAFYEKTGFKIAGRHSFRMGDEIQLDYIMKNRFKKAK
jgi:ribosomal protein S18 acetylase RimI-like enzyme